MRTVFLFASLALFTWSSANAQTTAPKSTQPKTTTPKTTQPKTQGPAPITAKDSMLCKPWKLTAVEEFSVKGKPSETQKNDAATFLLESKTAFVTLNGKQITGKWETDKQKKWITVTEDGTNQQWKFQVMKLTKDELVYEFQNPEDMVRTLFYFEPGPQAKK